MRDPHPANIQGRKVHKHEISHTVDWGYVAVGVGVLALAYVVYRAVGGSQSGSPEDGSGLVEDAQSAIEQESQAQEWAPQ